jgi:O-6-methylguanine DNA methyltransferase
LPARKEILLSDYIDKLEECDMAKIAILGSGAFGAALAVMCCSMGHDVTVWSRSPAELKEADGQMFHKKLPGVSVSREIDFQTELSGTPFQKLIWDMLLEIPFGQTITYGQLAKRAARAMGKEKMSSQAVGQAVSRNPIAIIIPCHRVMGAGGKPTGYAYGLEKELWLLNHEGSRR